MTVGGGVKRIFANPGGGAGGANTWGSDFISQCKDVGPTIFFFFLQIYYPRGESILFPLRSLI